MSLPTGQQRALDQIEKTLAHDHPALGPLFADFARVAGREPMPVTERVTARPRRLPWQRRMWPTVAGVVGLALVTVALFALSLTLPNRPTCSGTVGSSPRACRPSRPGARPPAPPSQARHTQPARAPPTPSRAPGASDTSA